MTNCCAEFELDLLGCCQPHYLTRANL